MDAIEKPGTESATETTTAADDCDARSDAERQRIWDLAWDGFVRSDAWEAIEFFGLAQEDFDELLGQGDVQERDRHLFYRGYAIHNVAYVEMYPENVPDVPERWGADRYPLPRAAMPWNTKPASPGEPATWDNDDEHSEEEADAIWDHAHWAVTGSNGTVAIYFYRPGWREFDRLLKVGIVREEDRDVFLRAWAAHGLKFVETNPDLLPKTTTATAEVPKPSLTATV